MSELGRDELVSLVRRIMNSAGSQEEIDEWIRTFGRNVPHPSPSDLIFLNDEELSAEEIVDQALAYKPIRL